MIEQLQNKETSPELSILKETKQQLSTLKEQILSKNLEPKREGFGDYLQNNGIDRNRFPRTSGLGKFLRTFRYYKDIKNIALAKDIPVNYFFGLKMIEGEGDPTNINTVDGGAGISQIQPDTFKQFGRDNMKRNFKVFSDDPKYADYSYDKLMEKHKNRAKVNGIIAEKLCDIKKYDCKTNGVFDMTKLMALDDRFNPQIALEFSAEYLLYCKRFVDTKGLTDKSWDKHKNDKDFDFERMLAFNGYNKGPKNFAKNFEGSHITNLKTRVGQYDLYSNRLTDLIKAGYSFDDIVQNINKTPDKRKKSLPKYDPSQKNTENITYLNDSQDKQRYVYKYIVSSEKSIFQQIQIIYSAFGKDTIQITDAAGKEYEPSAIPTTPGSVFYIKQKKIL